MKNNKKSKKELDAYKRGFEDGFKNCYHNVGETFESLFKDMHKFINNLERTEIDDFEKKQLNENDLM